MHDAIIVSIISAVATILTVILTNRTNQRLLMAEFDKKLALIEQTIDTLTAEVRRHNGYADKIPVMQEQIKELQRRS